MDYKYIQQLLEGYWKGETSLEEEEILRAFFRQSALPAEFERYRSWFAYEEEAAKVGLGADFDARVLEKIGDTDAAATHNVRARRVVFHQSLRPLWRAAAVVAIVLTLGNAAQRQFARDDVQAPDYNYATYKDTYTDPQTAFDEVSSALKQMSTGLRADAKQDSSDIFKNVKSE